MASGRHFKCDHVSHESHCRPCWLHFTGLWHTPHGHFQLRGPWFNETSPHNNSISRPYEPIIGWAGRTTTSPNDGPTEGVGMRSVIRASGVAEADDPCFDFAQMPIARIIGRNTTMTNPAEWVIPEPAMLVTVGVAMVIVRSSLTDRELSDTNTVCQQVN